VDAALAARARRRFGYLLGFIVLTVAVAVFLASDLTLSPEALRAAILGWGVLAPIVYIAIVSVRPFIFFPSWLLFIVAGLAFGPLFGTLYAVTGGLIAAVLSFQIARSLGREFVQAHLPARLREFEEDQWGAGLVFFLMLVPIVPMTVVNYGAGLSRVALGHYVLAVLGGLTPRALAYTYFGDSLFDVGSPRFLAALGALALLVIVPALFRRRWMARWRQNDSGSKMKDSSETP